jgi:predicted transcriptional regulator
LKKTLLDVIFASERRKSVLLLLYDGPRKMDDILGLLKTNRPALLPQIRILEEKHLITYQNGSCELTPIGKLITEKVISLVRVSNVLDRDIEFFGTHNFSFVPEHLMMRIGELGNFKLSKPEACEVLLVDREYVEYCSNSNAVYLYTKSFYPKADKMFSSLVSKDVAVNIIAPGELLHKVKNDCSECFRELMKNRCFNLYVCQKEIELFSIGLNDHCFTMRPLRNDGTYDGACISCSSPSALEWGKELFHCYLQESLSITEI